MGRIDSKKYRNFLITNSVLIASALFLSISVVLVATLATFFNSWNIQYFSGGTNCPQQLYLQHLKRIPIIQIIFIVMMSIIILSCLFILITLLICYRRQNNTKYVRGSNMHQVQIAFLMISLLAGYCALLYTILTYSYIEELKRQWQDSQQLRTSITSNCFTEQSYQVLKAKNNLLFSLIILIAGVLLLLIMCLFTSCWLIFQARNNKKLKKHKKKRQVLRPVEATFEKILENFSQQVSSNTFKEEELIDEPEIQLLAHPRQFRDMGVGDYWAVGSDGVSIGVSTERAESRERGISARVQMKTYGFGDSVVYEKQAKEEPVQEIKKSQLKKSRFYRTQLTQFHSNHPEQMRTSQLRIKKQPEVIHSVPDQREQMEIRTSARTKEQDQPKKKKNYLNGYYFFDSSDQSNEKEQVNRQLPKVQQNEKILVQDNQLPYNVLVNRQYIVDETPKSNRSGIRRSETKRQRVRSQIKNRYLKSSRRQIFEPTYLSPRHKFQY